MEPCLRGLGWCPSPLFQFLSRNSVGWNTAFRHPLHRICTGFNSLVGILSVGTRVPGRHQLLCRRFNSLVGILSVGTDDRVDHAMVNYSSFNSLVGILSVGTRYKRWLAYSFDVFQFLSRNSVGWNRARRATRANGHEFQFLSRNSVGWNDRPSNGYGHSLLVSIP